MNIVLGVAGGIAAYKAVEVLRTLTERGHDVHVVPTANALRFVGAATWSALSQHPVHTEVFDDADQIAHVSLGRNAQLVLVAPATADLLARAATGAANDLLTNALLTSRCPVMFAPAMHTEMWEHPATVANVATLRERGAVVLPPAHGRLAGSDTGVGRLPDPEEIAFAAERVLARVTSVNPLDLAGKEVVVSAGGTREYLDPVRFLGNRSSGRQGYALARTAVARGARVTLVSANVALPAPAGANVVRVQSTDELARAMYAASPSADAIVMAAAPADFRPLERVGHKLKKTNDGAGPTVVFAQTPDILRALVARRAHAQVIVGFAAETGDEQADPLTYGRRKFVDKGCDLLVVNEVGDGMAFESFRNAATILGAGGAERAVSLRTKEDLADAVWDEVARCWGAQPTGPPLPS